LLIVRDLMRGERYFDDFLRSPEGITGPSQAIVQAL
jgi:hypothetical protein